MKVVLDEGVPRQMAKALVEKGFEASRFPPEWIGTRNGDLIEALGRLGIDILLTNDKNIANQQGLRGRTVSVVALQQNKRSAIFERVDDIVDTLREARPGQHIMMGWDGRRTSTRTIDGEEVREDLHPIPRFEA
ncbi:MAG: hypothetical protein H7Y08_01180 [Rhizobiaceae bacterium]|nr:hypothetical protein [Rhizobiaceae bacterium]